MNKNQINISFTVYDASEAIKFYQEAIGLKVNLIHKAESDQERSFSGKSMKGKVTHSELQYYDSIFYVMDSMLENSLEYNQGSESIIYIEVSEEQEGLKIFNGLMNDGKVLMNYEKQFYNAVNGIVQDKFGITWSIIFKL